MLSPFLEQVDREHVPVYLESTTIGSRRLYERFGFLAKQTVRLPFEGPEMYLMVREARFN